MDEKLTVRVARDPLSFDDSIRVLVCTTDFPGRVVDFADPLVMRRREPGQAIQETFRLPKEGAQALMDGLWECGMRPTEGTGSAGSLAATQRHLEDMRTLVFKSGAPK